MATSFILVSGTTALSLYWNKRKNLASGKHLFSSKTSTLFFGNETMKRHLRDPWKLQELTSGKVNSMTPIAIALHAGEMTHCLQAKDQEYGVCSELLFSGFIFCGFPPLLSHHPFVNKHSIREGSQHWFSFSACSNSPQWYIIGNTDHATDLWCSHKLLWWKRNSAFDR